VKDGGGRVSRADGASPLSRRTVAPTLAFAIAVWGAVWVWAALSSGSSFSDTWKPLALGGIVAIAADQRAKRMGLECRAGTYVLHSAVRRQILPPGAITAFRVEPVRARTVANTSTAVYAYTDDGRVRVPTLTFVPPGWRERWFGAPRLVWAGGKTTDVESTFKLELHGLDSASDPRAAARRVQLPS
jgi:hypothetical protein